MVSGKTTQYSNGFQYVDGILQFMPTAEGYYDFTQKRYVYNLKDHLGNNRISFYHNPTTQQLEILTESHYYPFGMEQDNPRFANNNGEYKYKYNAKEYQDELGLDWYDYGARNYDASLGRWFNVDPLAENGRRWSPYNYALNNPIYFIDPDGMWVKGAGFWRNITSSDARIHAEEFASKNEGTVVKGRNGFSVYYSGDNSSSKAFFPNKDSKVTPSSIGIVSALEARNPNCHGALNVDMFELLGMTGVAAVQAGIESTGVDKDDAAVLSSVLVTVYDLKGLKVNKVINNVDDLLEAAVKTAKQPRTASKINKEIIGDAGEIFTEITKGMDIGTTKQGYPRASVNGYNVINRVSTKGNGKTISVSKDGVVTDIRVKEK